MNARTSMCVAILAACSVSAAADTLRAADKVYEHVYVTETGGRYYVRDLSDGSVTSLDKANAILEPSEDREALLKEYQNRWGVKEEGIESLPPRERAKALIEKLSRSKLAPDIVETPREIVPSSTAAPHALALSKPLPKALKAEPQPAPGAAPLQPFARVKANPGAPAQPLAGSRPAPQATTSGLHEDRSRIELSPESESVDLLASANADRGIREKRAVVGENGVKGVVLRGSDRSSPAYEQEKLRRASSLIEQIRAEREWAAQQQAAAQAEAWDAAAYPPEDWEFYGGGYNDMPPDMMTPPDGGNAAPDSETPPGPRQ